MKEDELKSLLEKARNGDRETKNTLIGYYKPYVINILGHICKRYISWNDEESSIGLIAFDKALNTYKEEKGKSFLNYAYMIIKRDLIDYFRKDKRKILSLNFTFNEEEHESENFENNISVESYKESLYQTNLVNEILELSHNLDEFGISFEELEHYSPKHKDTREALKIMAEQFLTFEDLVDELVTRKRLPVTLMIKKTGYNIKTIERHRKYLITLLLIKLNKEWVHLSSFLDNNK